MKRFFGFLSVLLLVTVIAASTVGVGAIAFAESAEAKYLYNPYEGVDFSKIEHQLANMHSHSKVFEGTYTASEMVEMYKELGYTYFVLTEHDRPSPPTGDEFYGDTDYPVINGEEFSFIYHHMNAYFTQFSSVTKLYKSQADLIADSVKADPLTRYVINHPGRHYSESKGDDQLYNLDWYLNLYNTFPELVGLEVFNTRNKYPNDWKLYDKILTELMPYRPVWASAGDDNHGEDFGYSFATMLGRDNTVEEWKRCLEQGHFFASTFSRYPVENLEAGGKPGDRFNYTPKVTNIVVDREAMTIELTTENCTEITWRTENGEVVGSDKKISYANLNKYVRAELRYVDGGETVCTTFSQPFGIGEYKEDTYWDYYKPAEEPEVTAIDYKEASLIALGVSFGFCIILAVLLTLIERKREKSAKI